MSTFNAREFWRKKEEEEKNKRKDDNTSSATKTTSNSFDARSFWKRKEAEQSIGFDTFGSELNTMNSTLSGILGGWQTADTMDSTRPSVEKMYKRLGAYEDYRKNYGDNSLTDLSELLGAYESTLGGWDDLTFNYNRYNNVDEYNKAQEAFKKSAEEAKKMETEDLGVVESEIGQLEELLKNAEAHESKIKGLENRKNTWEHRSRGLNTDGGYSDKIKVAETEYSDFLSGTGYTNAEAVKKALEDRKVYLSKAKLVQSKALLASVADINSENYDKDFEKYAEMGKAMGNNKKSFSKRMSEGGLSENDLAFYRENPIYVEAVEEALKIQSPIAKSVMTNSDYLGWAAKYMSDEEFKIYNYYYGKGDKESAEKYLASIEEDIKNRQGYDIYKNQEGVFEKFIFGAEAGFDQFTQGVANAFNFTDDYIPASPTQVASSWVREDIRQNQGAFGQGVYDLTTTTANMLPSILASTATNIIAPGVGSYVGAGLMGLSASGNAYQEMLNLGYSKGQARNYSILVGASEVALEKVLGGISALGGQTTARLTKVLGKVDNGLARFALNLGASALSEGFEEGLQEVLTPIFKDIAVGVDTGEEVNWDEVVYSALLGAASGGLMEGGPLAVSSVQQHMGNVATGKDLKAAQQVGNVFDIASMSPEESEAYEAYSRYMKKGITAENISNAKLGNLYNTLSSEVNPTYMSAVKDMGKSRMEIAKQKAIRESETSSEKQKSKATAKLDKAISNYNEAQTTIGKYGERFFKLNDVDNKVSDAKYIAETKAEAKKISADVETSVIAESNEAVDFKGVEFDGKDTKIITNDGKVSIDDVKLSETDAHLITIAKDMDARVASAFVSAYDRSSNVDVEQYLNDFNLVSGYAVNERFTPEYILQHRGSLTEKQAVIIADISKDIARQKEAEFNKLISTTANNTPYTGIIDDSIFKNGTVNYNRLDKRQKNAIQFLKVFAAKSGMNLTFEPEYENTNGWFDKKTNTLHISVGAGIKRSEGMLKDTIIPTASHEITHWMEEKSPELWEKLKNVALDALEAAYKAETGKDITQADIIALEVKRLDSKHSEKKHTADDAVREIVARCCEDMLSMSEEGRKMFDTMSEAEQKTFKEKVMEIINNLKEWINELLSSYGTQTEEAKLLRNYKEKLEEMSKIWDEMLVRSIEVNQALEKADAFNHLENGISEDGTTIVGANNLQMSDKTYRDGGRDFLVKWLSKRKDLTQREKWDIVEQTDRIAELMRAIAEGNDLPDYSNWANMEVVKTEEGEAVSVIVSNGDYKLNIDFSQVCKKRVALDAILNAMVTSGDLNTYVLTETDISELNDVIKKHDFEIACALCFVDAKRYRVGAWADSFCEGADVKDGGKTYHKYGFNEMVRSLVPKGSKLNIDEFNFTNRDIENQPTKNLLSEADDSELDFTLIDKIMSENDIRSAQHRYARAIKENPEIRKILNSSEIISSIGLDNIRVKAPAVYKLINGHQGTAKPKFAHSGVAYGNNVLQARGFTAKSAKMVGGVRCQSFSDFMANMVVDYAQFVSELAAKKLTAHSYTKEPLFVKLFGLTGMKINMSLVPKAVDMTPEQQKYFSILKDKNADKKSNEYKAKLVEYEKLSENAGLDENGNYIWEDETFPYDIAMEIVTDTRYSKNCGTIAVGISNNHIRKLLADERISMVIPYHKSSLNHEVAMMRDIALYNDYTAYQNTRDKATGSKLDKDKGQKDFDFYGDLYGTKGKEGTHDPKKTAQNYLAWCDGNNYIPKFDEFALNPNYYKLLIDFRVYDVDGTYVEQQPVQAIYPSNEEFNDLILNGVKDEDGKVYGGLKQQQETSDRLDAESQQIVAEFKQRLAEKYGEDVMQFSDKGDRLTETDLNEYLRAGTRRNISKQKALAEGKKIILTSEDEITSFIHDSINGSDRLITVGYGRVTPRLSQEVDAYSKGKINIDGNFLELVPDDIGHAYNEHLNAKEDGDINLSMQDFENIPSYIDNFDELVYAIQYANGNTRICLSKKLPNGRVLIIETVSKSRGSIAFKNMIGVTEEKYVAEYVNEYKKRNSTNTGGSKSSNISPHDGTASTHSILDSSEKSNEHFVNNEGNKQYSDKDSGSFSTEGMTESDIENARNVINNLKTYGVGSRLLSGFATYTEDRLNTEIKDSSSADEIDYAKSYITWVNPIDFVYATTTSEDYRKKLKEEAGALDIEKLRNYDKPIHLTVNFETGEIVGHEGRHRMLALQAEGVDKVVVIIDALNDNRHHTKPIDFMSLKGQNFGDYRKGTDMYLHDMLPLSKRYADVMKGLFASKPKSNIQFSDKDTTSVYDVMGETENIVKENKWLEEDVARLGGIIGTGVVASSRYAGIARYLKNLSGSNIDTARLGRMLKDTYTSMQKADSLSWSSVATDTYEIASTLMNPELKVSFDYFKRIMHEIRSEKISLSAEQKTRINERFGSYGKFYQSIFGRVNISDDGKPLTELWSELSTKHPSLFETDLQEADQIDALVEAVHILKSTDNKMAEYEREEAIRHLSNVIYNQLWNIASDTSTMKEAQQYKAEHKKLMDDIRRGHEERQKALVIHPTGETALKYEKMLRKAKEKNSEIKALGKQRMAEYKESVERKSRIQSITANTLTLADWYVTNSKDKHIPDVLKGPVKNLIDAIDFSSKRLLDKNIPTQKDISLAKALNKVRNMMIDASKGNADLVQLYGHNLDEDIEKMMDSIDMMDRTIADNEYILQKMSLEDLATLDKMVKAIKASVSKMNKFHIVNHAKGIASLSQTAMVEMDKLGKAKVYEGLRGKIDKTLMWNNAIPVYAFKRFGEAGTKVFEALQDGWDKFAFNVKKILDFAEKTYTSKEVEEWEATVKTFDIRVPATEDDLANPDYKPQFQKVQMTIPQIMSLHCLYKREQAKQHLIGGGIRVADFTVGKKVISQTDGLVFTKENVETIISTLSKRQVEVADKIQEFMNTVCSEWGNEVSMARFGIRQFGEENYFPIQSDKNNLAVDDETEKANSLFRLLNMSFSKSLTPGANNRIVISNIFDVFAQHSSDMAKYNALALPVLDTFRWYNYTEKHEVGDDAIKTNGVKQAMEKAFGSDGKNYFTTFLKDINGQKEVSRDTLGAGLFTNAKIAAVGANLRVVLLQPTSYVRASAIIDNKYLTKALMFKPKTDKAQEHCGIAQWKAIGYYDTNIQKGVADQIKGVKTWKDKAQEWSMKGAEKADSLTWGYLWNACELEIRDTRKDLKVGSKEFYDAISKRLREVIYATQVVDSTMTRSQMMRSSKLYDKMLTAFASEPTLAYNMVVDAYVQFSLDKRRMSKGEAWRKNRTHIARVASAYIMTNAVAALVESAFDAYRDDDDEEKDLVYFMKTYLSNFAQDMSLVGKIPYIKDIVSIFQGYGASRTDIAWMESLYKALTGTWKLFTSDNGNPGKVAKNWIKFVSSTKGLPLYNIYRDTKLEKLISEMFEENS